MSRLQSVLVLIAATLAVIVFGRIAWDLFAMPVTGAIAAVPALVQSVPGWVWWTAFGALWWLPRAFGKRACWTGRCRTSTQT